jgi:hypothetical protein
VYPTHPTGLDQTDLVFNVWNGSILKEALRILYTGEPSFPNGLLFADGTKQATAVPTCTLTNQVPIWSAVTSRWTCGVPGGGGGADPDAVHITGGGVCSTSGEVPTWSSISSLWTCAVPSGGPPPANMVSTDAAQEISAVKTFTANPITTGLQFSGDSSIQTTAFVGESDPTVNALAKATLACSNGQIAKMVTGTWTCAAEGGGGGEGATYVGDKTITGSLTVNGTTGNLTLMTGILNLASGGIHFADGSVLTSAMGTIPLYGREGASAVGTSATLVGTTSSKVSINIQNNHYAGDIYCGLTNLVSAVTGTKVPIGGSISMDYGGAVYCISPTYTQYAPYTTRYLEMTTVAP